MSAWLPALLLAAGGCAGLLLTGEYARPRRAWLTYFFKPLTTILILVIALLPGTFATENYARAIALGLLFSLMGDIWLMLPRDRFLYGLASFLVAQLCYAFAFAGGASAQGFGWVAFALALVGVLILRYLWQGLPGALRPAVLLYVAAILAMAALAVGRALAAPSPGSISAAIGALLFTASDATLAINRFRKPFPLAQAVIWLTYFSAQLLIALSTTEG